MRWFDRFFLSALEGHCGPTEKKLTVLANRIDGNVKEIFRRCQIGKKNYPVSNKEPYFKRVSNKEFS
jgi:hypothetical protein